MDIVILLLVSATMRILRDCLEMGVVRLFQSHLFLPTSKRRNPCVRALFSIISITCRSINHLVKEPSLTLSPHLAKDQLLLSQGLDVFVEESHSPAIVVFEFCLMTVLTQLRVLTLLKCAHLECRDELWFLLPAEISQAVHFFFALFPSLNVLVEVFTAVKHFLVDLLLVLHVESRLSSICDLFARVDVRDWDLVGDDLLVGIRDVFEVSCRKTWLNRSLSIFVDKIGDEAH